jgi:phosphoribosylanthranilate isomerase
MSVKVKICGITNFDDAALAVALGADCLGFVFADSPRRVTGDTAAAIIRKLKKIPGGRDVATVGVFVNEHPAVVWSVLTQSGITLAQLHGNETVQSARGLLFPWYKAVRIATTEDVDAELTGTAWPCSRILIDKKKDTVFGGTGEVIPVPVALHAGRAIRKMGKEFFLAGGITPDNVRSIIETVQPDGIDVSSGVEERKGRKSRDKMERLFKEVHTIS